MNYSLRIFHFIPGSSPSLEPVNLWDGSGQTLPAFIPPCSCPAQLSSEGWGLSWEGDKMQFQPPLWRNQCPIGSKGAVMRVQPIAFPFNGCSSWVNIPATETLVQTCSTDHWWKYRAIPVTRLIITFFFHLHLEFRHLKAKIAVGRTSSALPLTEGLFWRGEFFQPERSIIASNTHVPWTQV